MKKKIAFIMGGATVGGAEIALKRMLKKFDLEKYDVSLFTNVKGNPCVIDLDKRIALIDLDNFALNTCFFESIKRLDLLRAINLLLCYIGFLVSKREWKKNYYLCKPFELSSEEFDCAIAYKHDFYPVAETLFHIKAKKKAVWIHGALRGGQNPDKEYVKWLESFDKVFCVSKAVKESFERYVPNAAEKTELFYNLIDSDEIREKAGALCAHADEIILTTVGRLGKEKGQIMIPQIARYLLDAGYPIKWYVVGNGVMRTALEEECQKLGVTEHVILTGTQSNPYPYIKNCDIYVQTSFSEGYCTTTIEAKILQKAIVTTDAPGMREQFRNGENGLITDAMTPQSLFKEIRTLLDNPELCRKFVEELKMENCDNSIELEKIYAFLEA